MASMKEKYNSILNKLNEEKGSSSSSSDDRIKRIYPKNILNDHKGKIRILPQGDDLWFFETKTHMFSVSSGWKVSTCLSTTNKEGNVLGDCPICAFMEKHKLEKDAYKQIVAKTNLNSIAYSYKTNTKYIFVYNEYFLKDILTIINETFSEEDMETVDAEGFDVTVGTNDQGYPCVEDVTISRKSLDELKIDTDDIENLETVCLPEEVNDKLIEYMESMIKIFAKAFCPEYAPKSSSFKKSAKLSSVKKGFSTLRKSKPFYEEDDEEDEIEEYELNIDDVKSDLVKKVKKEDSTEEDDEDSVFTYDRKTRPQPKNEVKKPFYKAKKEDIIEDEEDEEEDKKTTKKTVKKTTSKGKVKEEKRPFEKEQEVKTEDDEDWLNQLKNEMKGN